MKFQSCGSTPVNLIHEVGIAIRATNIAQRGMHIGVVYRNSEGEQRFLHLAFHYDLRDEPAPTNPQYFWADCSWLDGPDAELSRDIIAAYIESVSVEAKIPYGINAANIKFDSGGHYISLDPQNGLTCATFVATLFASIGFPVVDLTTWIARPDDEEWRNIIMAVLQENESNRAEEVAGSSLDFRLRPDEVAGASTGEIVPLKFEDAIAAGEPIRSKIFR